MNYRPPLPSPLQKTKAFRNLHIQQKVSSYRHFTHNLFPPKPTWPWKSLSLSPPRYTLARNPASGSRTARSSVLRILAPPYIDLDTSNPVVERVHKRKRYTVKGRRYSSDVHVFVCTQGSKQCRRYSVHLTVLSARRTFTKKVRQKGTVVYLISLTTRKYTAAMPTQQET